MNRKTQEFFSSDAYFFTEKAPYLKYSYPISTEHKEQMGMVKEIVPPLFKVLNVFLNRVFFPFKLSIQNNKGETLVSVKRGWTFIKSKIEVFDAEDNMIALINQHYKGLKASYTILDAHQNLLASISGEAKTKNYAIFDDKDNRIGTITKDWAGILKEVFRKADKYALIFDPPLAVDTKKIAIAAMAITIDMV